MDVPSDFLGDPVRLECAPVGDHGSALHPDEAACVARAVEKRRHQFSTGRVLAHRLLAGLGVEHAPLLPGDDRAPIWPVGAVGTITHSASQVVVAVARTEAVRALGVDVEESTPLEDELHGQVLTATEVAWVAGRPAAERGDWAKLVFSAKEAVYKAQYGLSRTMLDFHDVELSVDPEGETFEARLPAQVVDAVGASTVAGRWTRSGGHLLTGVVLRI